MSSSNPENDRHADDARQIAAQMEALATSGEWQKVEECAARLKPAILAVPPDRRRDTVLAIRRDMNKVQALAERERASVADKLSQIHRGRDATRAYGMMAGARQK